MNLRLFLALALVALAGLARGADSVYLTDGTEVSGTVVEENNNTVMVKRASGMLQSFRRADVDAIVYEKKAPPQPAVPPPAPVAETKKPPVAARKDDVAGKGETAAAPGAEAKPGAAEATPKDAEGTPKDAEGKAPEPGAAPKEGEAQAKVAEAPGKEGEAKTKEGEAKTKEGEAKTKEAAAAKTEPGKKEGESTAAAATKDADRAKDKEKTGAKEEKKEEGKGKETAEAKDEKKDEWAPPPGLPGFPDHAKRLSKEKEEAFMAALAKLATVEEAPRLAAKAEIAAIGAGVLPYIVAGCYHANVEARSSCMYLVGELNGRNAVKQAIEAFYSAMPAGENEAAPTYQVPFIRAIKTALPAITGQAFISVEPDKPLVQRGLTQYVDWYNQNFDRLPPQLGEKDVEATDPDYMKKLKEARALKLEKKSWPRPPLSADIVQGAQSTTRPPPPTAKDLETPAGKALRDSIPTVKRGDVGKR